MQKKLLMVRNSLYLFLLFSLELRAPHEGLSETAQENIQNLINSYQKSQQ